MLGFASILSMALTGFVYVLILITVYRIYQMSTDVAEVKQLLKDIKQNTSGQASRSAAPPLLPAAAPSPGPTSAEALVRAVHSASYEDLDRQIADSQ